MTHRQQVSGSDRGRRGSAGGASADGARWCQPPEPGHRGPQLLHLPGEFRDPAAGGGLARLGELADAPDLTVERVEAAVGPAVAIAGFTTRNGGAHGCPAMRAARRLAHIGSGRKRFLDLARHCLAGTPGHGLLPTAHGTPGAGPRATSGAQNRGGRFWGRSQTHYARAAWPARLCCRSRPDRPGFMARYLWPATACWRPMLCRCPRRATPACSHTGIARN